MSKQPERAAELPVDGIAEEDVTRYLRAHPDYFEAHAGLLAQLRLPHHNGGNTVSLVERQVSILRDRSRKLDQKLRELIAAGRANDALARRIHQLSLRLVAVGSLPDVLAQVAESLRVDLESDLSVLMLFDDGAVASLDLFDGSFVRRIARDDAGLGQFRSFLEQGRPRCGQVQGPKRDFLFGTDDGAEIRSAALIPLGERTELGFLAVGSRDPVRFHPAMSTDFLARIGELVTCSMRAAA